MTCACIIRPTKLCWRCSCARPRSPGQLEAKCSHRESRRNSASLSRGGSRRTVLEDHRSGRFVSSFRRRATGARVECQRQPGFLTPVLCHLVEQERWEEDKQAFARSRSPCVARARRRVVSTSHRQLRQRLCWLSEQASKHAEQRLQLPQPA